MSGDFVFGGYSTKRVSEMTGATYRQLDRWARLGVVGPAANGSGSRRRWSTNEVLTARVLAAANIAVKPRRAFDSGGLDASVLDAIVAAYVGARYPRSGYIVFSSDQAEYVEQLRPFVASAGAAVVIDLASALSTPALLAIGGPPPVGVDSGAAGPSATGRGDPPPRVQPTAAADAPTPAPARSNPARDEARRTSAPTAAAGFATT